jgi:exosortase/archaeosortase family protein
MSKWSLTTSLLKDKLNLFYVLAFVPLLPIQYFGYVERRDFVAALIPLYGFLLLLIKKDKLSVFSDPGRLSRFAGLILMVSSLFVYYAVALFYPKAQFYGVANYTVYLVGLFLAFFPVSALKQSFTTLFLIVGATAITFVGKWMEFLFEPAVPFFVQIIASILWVLGISAKLVNPTWFILQTRGGETLPLGVAAGCIGIHSFLAFSLILVVTMMEDPSSLRTKVIWSVAGIIGTFFVNLVRVSLIFVVIYYFGFERWGEIHTPIGYALVLLWLAFFFLIFSKRQDLLRKLQTFRRKLR